MTTPGTESTLERVPRNTLATFACLGLTTGLYTGWSITPVVGTMLGGVLSTLSAVTLLFLSSGKSSFSASRNRMLEEVFHALCIFLVASIVGTGVGIFLRTERLPFTAEAETEGPHLPEKSTSASPNDLARILRIQKLLLDNGVSYKDSETLVARLIDESVMAGGKGERALLVKDLVKIADEVDKDVRAANDELKRLMDALNSLLQKQAISREQFDDIIKQQKIVVDGINSIIKINAAFKSAQNVEDVFSLDLDKIIKTLEAKASSKDEEKQPKEKEPEVREESPWAPQVT